MCAGNCGGRCGDCQKSYQLITGPAGAPSTVPGPPGPAGPCSCPFQAVRNLDFTINPTPDFVVLPYTIGDLLFASGDLIGLNRGYQIEVCGTMTQINPSVISELYFKEILNGIDFFQTNSFVIPISSPQLSVKAVFTIYRALNTNNNPATDEYFLQQEVYMNNIGYFSDTDLLPYSLIATSIDLLAQTVNANFNVRKITSRFL